MAKISDQNWLSPWLLEKALADMTPDRISEISSIAEKLPADYVIPGALSAKLLRSEIFRRNFRFAQALLKHAVLTLPQALDICETESELSEISFLILRRAMELDVARSKASFAALCSRLVPRLLDVHGNFFEEISGWILSEAVVADLSSRLEISDLSRSSFSDALYSAVRACGAQKFPGFLISKFHSLIPSRTFAFFECLIERSEISSRNFRSLSFCWEAVRSLHVYRPREDGDGRMKRRLLWSLEISSDPEIWKTLMTVDPSTVLESAACRKFLREISDPGLIGNILDFLVKKATLAEYLEGEEEISDYMNAGIEKFPIQLDLNVPLLMLCLRRKWWKTLSAVIGNSKVEISRVEDARGVFDEILTAVFAEKAQEISGCKLAVGKFFVFELQPWLSEFSAREISDRIWELLSRKSVGRNFRSQAAALRLLMIGNFVAFGNLPDSEISAKLISISTADSEGLEILTKDSAVLRFVCSVAEGENFRKISEHARNKFPAEQLPDEMRSEICSAAMEICSEEKTAGNIDLEQVLSEIARDLENCGNFRTLWEPLVFSVNGRGLPCDGIFRGRNFQEISDLLDEVISGEISMPRIYASTVMMESMKKTLGSKRVSKILAWLESGNFHTNFQVMSRTLSALAMAARTQPHLRVCEKLLEISSALAAERNFQAAYWSAYVSLVSGRDRTGEQAPWWTQRPEKLLRNFRLFAYDPEGVPFLQRLLETVSGNLTAEISVSLTGPLVLDIVMKFPCPQENELKPVLFALFSAIGNHGLKNLHAVCDQRYRDILKGVIDEFNFRHKFRGKV